MWEPGGGTDEPPGINRQSEVDQTSVEMLSDMDVDQTSGAVGTEISDVTVDVKDKCEENKNQLDTLKEIMLRNKQSLKQKEEEVQEYARKLSNIKTRIKKSRRSRDAASSVESTPEAAQKSKTSSPLSTSFADVVDDVRQARTPKAKSSLLQKKLAENKIIFEQRSREMTENKRVVEEKVEAIRQKLEENDSREIPTAVPVQQDFLHVQAASSSSQLVFLQDKDNRIAELNNRVIQLEAEIIDLKENLREKDSVIRSKTKAVTLVSEDLSKRSKSTLDTLEDTKDEMRTMQANFVLVETSLKHKVDNLLTQLQERDEKITEFEDIIQRLKTDIEKQKITDTATADFSRSTLDTLAETKEAMKTMQENFVLIESALKAKNDNLLEQLQDRDRKLSEAEEKIFRLESGVGATTPLDIDQLQRELHTIKQSNRLLQDEKYELQKAISEYQAKLISNESVPNNGLIEEKDNRIAELENLVEELRKSNELLLEESKSELQSQIVDLTSKNEEYSNKVNDLEKLLHNIETERNELIKEIPESTDESKEDSKVLKLSKELDDLNKSMIKLKAQHKGKVKSLQKQLESFRKVIIEQRQISDANAELVKLGNQVALLEEEKGNLQLSLVDFDELKVSAGDWQERISDLESKLSAQASEIDSQVQSIATLENQKLDLMQELHTVKQDVSALEAENAESENLRVTAEMKIVELEEQLDSLQKSINAQKQSDSIDESEKDEYLKKIEHLSQENNNLIVKLAKLEEKGTSDAGSTESFETIHETDRMELLKKIEILTQENNDLIIRLTKLEERTGSTESFDNLNERDRNELMKKMDLLTHENNELHVKLAKLEEKGSSDSGSTESFERIPSEPTDTSTRLDILTQENNELVIKVIKLEEKLAQIGSSSSESPSLDDEVSKLERRIDFLTRENSDLVIRITKLQERMEQFSEVPASGENIKDEALHDKLKVLVGENNELVIKMTKLEESSESLKIDLDLVTKERDELKETVAHVSTNPFATHLIEKLSKIHQESERPAQDAREQVVQLLRKLDEETGAIESADRMGQIHREDIADTSLEKEIEACKKLISEQKEMIEEMEMKIAEKQVELDSKAEKIAEYEAAGTNVDALRAELDESLAVTKEWKLRCEQMEEKMQILEKEKAAIAEGLKLLEADNAGLVKKAEKKDTVAKKLKKTLDETIARFEERLEEERSRSAAKEEEVAALKEIIVTKENDLRDKYEKLQNEMITIDSLQDDMNKYKMQFQEQRSAIEYLNNEISELNAASEAKNHEVVAATAIVENLRKQLENSKTLEEFAQLTETLKQMQERIESQNTENNELQHQNEIVEKDNKKMRSQLTQKEHEIADFLEMTRKLEAQLKRAENSESELTAQVSHLENALSQNHIYMEDLKKELRGEYKKLELVKAQHVEDSSLQNRRLEDLIEELNSRNEENENLKKELRELQGRLEEIAKDDAKSVLQSKIIELEAQLTESQDKAKVQLDKMRKIAANLKKKATQCQELETKVTFLEEKFNSEKSEKDLINSRIFENERVIGEKDNRISELEIAVANSQRELTAASERASKLEEKVTSVLEQLLEAEQELDKLRSEINAKTLQLDEEKLAKENILQQYEAYKLHVTREMEIQQLALDEAKESTRELGVRMEVMEGEYVKQLTLIQNLKAENGLLSSKEAQINERLETVEKESEERRCLLEQTQQQKLQAIEKGELQKAQTLECELREEDCRSMQEQGRNSVEALEAKLQERDAVIESLEMELGRSNDKVNRLQETIVAAEERRYSLERKTELLGAELEQSVRITEEASFSEDMLEQRLATLMAKDEAISDKLNETIEENNELTEKIKTLQDLNVTLQERIDAVEEELKYNRETNDKLQNIDVLYSDLLEKATGQENELKKTQQELRSAKLHIDNSEREVTAQINQLDADKKHLLEKCEKLEDLRINLIQEVDSLKDGVTLCRQRISELESEVETSKDTNSQLRTELARSKDLSSSRSQTPEDVEKLKLMIAEKDAEIENYQRRNMQLQMAAFDPKSTSTSDVFGTSIISDSTGLSEEITKLNDLLTEKENERVKIYNELERCTQQLASLQLECEKLSNDNANIAAHSNELIHRNDQLLAELHNVQSTYDESRNEFSRLNETLSEKNLQIEALHLQLGEIRSGLQERENNSDSEIHRLTDLLASKDNDIARASAELNAAKEALEALKNSQRDNEILIENKNVLIDQLESAKSAFESQLDEWNAQRTEGEQIVNEIIAVAEQKVNKFYELSNAKNTGLRKVALTFQDVLTELEALRQEKDQLLQLQVSNQKEIEDLKKRFDPLTSSNSGSTSAVEMRGQEAASEREILQKQADLNSELPHMSKEFQTAEETVIKTVHSEVDAAWDTETGVKVELDDEGWGWSAEEAQLEEQHQLSTAPPPALSNLEFQLRTRIAELEDEIKDLTAEKVKLDEESKATQLKNVKLMKKLKEFKLQNDQLQQKLKKQSSGFADLDSAIEEELKSQIEALEKLLKEAKDEQKKAASEKEHLQKRLEVLTAANERFVEMKERQDMDVEVWQIRNKELTNKLQALEWQLQEVSTRANEDGFSVPSSQVESQTALRQSEPSQSQDPTIDSSEGSAELCKRYKEEIDDLKEEMEALASENEQLQQLLEELKVRLVDTEAKFSAVGATKLDETKKLMEQKTDVQTSLTKLQEEYNLLRKQYEQSLMDANDQVTAMRQNNDLVRMELDKKSREFDNEKELLLQEIEGRSTELKRLEGSLQLALRENSDLMERMTAETSSAEKLTSVSVSLAEVTELLNARVQEVADLKQEAQQKYLERTETENQLRENIAEISLELTNKQHEIEHLKQVLSDKVNEFAEQRSLESSNLHIEMDALKLAVAEKENVLKNMERVREESENLRKNVTERETNLEIIASELTSSRQQLAEKEYQLEQSALELSACKTQLENAQLELSTLKSVTDNKGELESWVANLQIQLSDKEKEIEELKTNLFEKTSNAEWYVQEIQRLSAELQSVHAEVEHIKLELQHRNVELERLTQILTQKDVTIDEMQRKLEQKLEEPTIILEKKSSEFVSLPDSLPRFTMSGVDDLGLEPNARVASLETQLREKQEEIEHLKYTLDENTYPALLQQLQDNINQLYIDKDNIEQSLQKTVRELNAELAMKQKEIENLNEVLANQQELSAVERTSALDQETIAKLQNELHIKEQEINELQYVIAEKNSEISMQASLVSQSDDYETQETLQRLQSELYASQQEIQNLKSNLAEKEEDVTRLKDVEKLLEEDRELVSKLTSEKESVREEAERLLQTRLIEKEAEIDALKQQLNGETQQLLAALQFKETDIENLRIQMEQLNTEHDDEVRRRDNELVAVKTDLAERERRLAELSVTKDTEIHNLRVQIHEKDVRISELIAMSDEEEKQLVELREVVERKEEEINSLKTLLAETVQEYEVIQKALRRNTSERPTSTTPTEGRVDYIEGSGDASIERTGVVSTEGELDLALYMLHHRDVRCEELTLELMQLLEERDTLQLRLSNAIRVNEELRQQTKCTESSKQESLLATTDEEPLIEHPSPSKSDGPVEIAKEALNIHISPIGEDKDALAAKLSQLQSVDQRRDVRLCDERESRHTQQMSFVSRRDMLKALPPEAAARLVNANYTLSRDVQSQSSVLMNWLWGKSTPKVMHM